MVDGMVCQALSIKLCHEGEQRTLKITSVY
jgi:hypothetical protein